MTEQAIELSREELLARYTSKPAVASAEATRRSPFKFLDAYEVDDADIFFGRDSETEELLGNYHRHGHVLIYGESGAGKSSLVQCGLRPRIPDADALFISLRVHTTGLPTICHQICAEASAQLGAAVEVNVDAGLVDTLHAIREAASRPLVLFFDQFEELFIFHDVEIRRHFANELAAIHASRLSVKVIIGIRQDYLAHLSELEETVEGVFDNRFWLRRMSRENAAEAAVKACDLCEVKIDADLAESILHRLDPAGQGVELPYLQVVMDRLYRRAVDENPAQPVISSEQLQQLGDITDILGTFLIEEVAKLPSPDTGRQILKAFVTRKGTRRALDREALAQEAAGFGEAISHDVLDVHLSRLTNVRILREIADTGTFELRHDSLAVTVESWISEVEKELIEVRDNLVNRFREFEARGQDDSALLDPGFINYLAVYRQRLAPLLDDALHRYIARSERHESARKRNRRLVIGGSLVSVVVAGFAGLLLHLASVTEERNRALEAEEAAQQAEREATDEAREAKLLSDFFIHHLRTSRIAEFGFVYEPASDDVIHLEIRDQARRANIFDELGDAFVKLGDLEKGEELLYQAISARESLPQTTLEDRRARARAIAETAADLGFLRSVQGRTEESAAAYTTALEMMDECGLSADDKWRCETRFLRNVVRSGGLARWDEKILESTFNELDRGLREIQQLQPEPESQAVILMTRAALKFEHPVAARRQRGVDLMVDAREFCDQVPDEDHFVHAMLGFYDVFFNYHDEKITDEEFENGGIRALARIRRAFGDRNPVVLEYERRFAGEVADPEMQEVLLSVNLDTCRRSYGEEPVVAVALFAWAEFLEKQAKSKEPEEQNAAFDEVEQQLGEAVELLKVAFEGDPYSCVHWRIGQAHLRLGQFYQRREELRAAKEHFLRAMEIFEQTGTLEYSELGVLCQRQLDRIETESNAADSSNP